MKGICPNETPECKYFATDGGCYSDAHHTFGRFKTGIAKEFANLAINKVQICRAEHDEIHATGGVLPLPSVAVMKQIMGKVY